MKLSCNLFITLSIFLMILVASRTTSVVAENECQKNSDGQCEGYEDPSCPSRPHIVRCAAAYLDTNKNNKLEKEELESAIAALPWYARGILKIIGSVPKIMEKCDDDGDGAIGIEHDMEATKDKCLATCFKRKSFKAAFFKDCDL